MSERVARISSEPLSSAEVEAAVQDSRHGAVVLFSGIVRDHDEGHAVETLEYRAHPDAERFLSRCCAEVSAETATVYLVTMVDTLNALKIVSED